MEAHGGSGGARDVADCWIAFAGVGESRLPFDFLAMLGRSGQALTGALRRFGMRSRFRTRSTCDISMAAYKS
jgi:hypothetical protein